jgi:two-component system, OmpR family, KDP operon response regulator KdpE
MMTSNSARVVLIVDDEIQIRRFQRAGFELDGFLVVEAATVAEGIKAATLQSPDLIILDLGLPDAEGAELVERVRSWSEVPIIILSVQSDEPEKVRMLELGADDYLVKPFGMAELLARAHAALRRYVRSTTGEPIIHPEQARAPSGSHLANASPI